MLLAGKLPSTLANSARHNLPVALPMHATLKPRVASGAGSISGWEQRCETVVDARGLVRMQSAATPASQNVTSVR